MHSVRTAAVAISGLLLTIALALPDAASQTATAANCTGPNPIADGRLVRLSGADRTATAIAISRDSFAQDGSAGAVVLARRDNFADALTGAPLAVRRGGPLLLTGKTALDDATLAEVRRVLPAGKRVFLVGGVAALSTNVTDAVTDAGYEPVRLSGSTRYGTAAAVAGDFGNPAAVGLASGQDFADALSLSAAAADENFPLLLTRQSSLPDETVAFLEDFTGSRVHVAGGTAAVSAAAAAAAETLVGAGTLTRYAGADRYDTSSLVAAAFYGTTPCTVAIASGLNYPDGLAGAAHAARQEAPLLLVSSTLPSTVQVYLEGSPAAISGAYLYGGSAAVDEVTAARANGSYEPDTFVFFGDSGFSNAHWNANAAQVVARVQSEDVDGVFALGDNIYPSGASSAADPMFATLYEGPLASILSTLSMYVVLGNHDVATLNGQGELDYALTHPWWIQPAHYYTRDIDRTCLVALDTNQAAVDQAQLDFLQGSCASPSTIHRVVIGHHPVKSSGQHGLNNDQPWMDTLVRPVLESTGTDFFLTGHDHNFEAIVPGADSVRYIISGGASDLRPITATAQSLFATSQYHTSKLELYTAYADLTVYDENGGVIWTYRYDLE